MVILFMVSYHSIRSMIVERIGEIQYDMDRNRREREELEKELKESKEALIELDEGKGKYFDEYI